MMWITKKYFPMLSLFFLASTLFVSTHPAFSSDPKMSIEDTPVLKIHKEKTSSKKLVVVFSSCDTDGPEFPGSMARARVFEESVPPNQIFISHPRSWYVSKQEEGLKDLLTKEIEPFGESNTYMIGSSMGGWGALLYGSFFPDTHVLVFSPQTYIGVRMPSWIRYEASEEGGIIDITSYLHQRENRGRTLVIVSSCEPFDLIQMGNLKKMPFIEIKIVNVEKLPPEEFLIQEFHNIAGVLSKKKALTPLLQGFLSPPPWQRNADSLEPEAAFIEDCPSPLSSSAHMVFSYLTASPNRKQLLTFKRVSSGSTVGERFSPGRMEDFAETLVLRDQLKKEFTPSLFSEFLAAITSLLATPGKLLHTYEHVAELLGEQVTPLQSIKQEHPTLLQQTKTLILSMEKELREPSFLNDTKGYASLADQLREETKILFE